MGSSLLLSPDARSGSDHGADVTATWAPADSPSAGTPASTGWAARSGNAGTSTGGGAAGMGAIISCGSKSSQALSSDLPVRAVSTYLLSGACPREGAVRSIRTPLVA